MERNTNDKKLLGNKKLLFNVIKKDKQEKESDKKKQVPGKFVTSICNRTSLALENNNTNFKFDPEGQIQKIENKEFFTHSSQASQLSNKENKASNISNITSQLLIGTKDFNFSWRDKSNITFDKIIWKYHINKDKSDNLSEIQINEIMNKNEYGFKLFFTDNPTVVFYSYEDVKNLNLQYLERKHRGKITEILIEVNERKEPLAIFNIPLVKLEKYKIHLRNLLDPNIIDKDKNPPPSLVEQFFLEFPQHWDYFENLAIKVVAERYTFQEYMCYICLYLYDNLRKLKDQKSTDHLRSKIKESNTLPKDLSYFSKEMMRYYTLRHEKMRSSLTPFIKEQKWTEDNSLIEIFITTLIYTKFQNSQEIDLTQHYILSDNIITVLSALKCNQSVTKLILNSNKIGEEGMWLLSRVLCYNYKLRDIDVSVNSLTDDSIKALITGRLDGLNLKRENFNFNLNLNPSPSDTLTPTLTPFSIVKLNLSSNQLLTHECGKYIAKIIEMSPYLNHLNLSKIALEDRGFEPILKTLINLAETKKMKLETLIAFHTKLGSETLELFSKLLSLPGCTLKSLVLSDNKFEYNSAIKLFGAIGVNNTLQELSLLNCEITNEMAEFIVKMISSNFSLKCLYLYNNKIESPVVFKKILSQFTKTIDVDLNSSNSNNQSNNQNLIANSFSQMPLTDLEILQIPDDVEFTIENIYDLKETKEENLEYLGDINGINGVNGIGNPNPIIRRKNMKYLDLSKNRCKIPIDDEFINIIENLDLESLDISQNFEVSTSDEDMVKRFKEAITKIQEKTKIIY
jgi:Ran GTPase-activating protein (RanGAP) involved in mRNA processing and transport